MIIEHTVLRSAPPDGLAGATLRFVTATDASLNGVAAARLTVAYSNLRNACLVTANLETAVVTSCGLVFANLTDADLTGARLRLVDATFARFTNARCAGARFTNCNLNNTVFTDADLTGAVFEGCTLAYANLENTVLSSTAFVNCSLAHASLPPAMRGAVLDHVDLREARTAGPITVATVGTTVHGRVRTGQLVHRPGADTVDAYNNCMGWATVDPRQLGGIVPPHMYALVEVQATRITAETLADDP